MKFLKLCLIGFCLVATQLVANGLQEGKDYILLDKPIANMDNTVLEIYNIGCPHCAYYNENFLPNLLEFLPENVEFLPYHIAAPIEIHQEISKILVVALSKDKQNKTSTKSPNALYKKVLNYYFDAIHKEKRNWKNPQDFASKGLEIIGIDEVEYQKILETKEAKEMLQKWQSLIEYANIQGVPSFIVNGKYMVSSQNLKGTEDFIYKIDYLLEKK